MGLSTHTSGLRLKHALGQVISHSGPAPIIALAGNPNTGKSTVFNALTGLKQHTGNWSGKTVLLASGHYSHRGRRFQLVDLPGTYSLLATSPEERVARDFLLQQQPDATVVVLDATCLERNLNLALQVLEITSRVVLCVNLMDEARRHGLFVDVAGLERVLGVPAVAAAARSGEGLVRLKDLVDDLVSRRLQPQPQPVSYSPVVEKAIAEVLPCLEPWLAAGINVRWLALRVLEGEQDILQGLREQMAKRLAPQPVRGRG